MGRTKRPDLAAARPVRTELLVIDLMNRLLDPGRDGIDLALDEVLGRIGMAFGLDRVFLFRNRPDGTHYNSHEWVAPGVTPLKPRMQALSPTVRASWHAAFVAGRQVRIANRNDLPPDMPERRFLEEIGVWSTLMLPLMDSERLIGVFGYDSQVPDRIWTEDEVGLLSSVGHAVSAVLMRHEAAAAEAAMRQHLEATLQALSDLVIEICPQGTILACHSDKLPWLSGLVRAGIGRPLAEVLPEALARVLGQIVADPPAPHTRVTRRVGLASLVAPHWYEVSVAQLPQDRSGARVGLVAVIRDLAAAETPSAMAAYREGQFTAFFEMCPHPILLNDYDTGELLDANRAFQKVFGLDPKATSGLHLRNLLPADAMAVIGPAIDALREQRVYGPLEARLRRVDGSCFPAVLRGFMSIDPNGRRLVWALIEDVTEIRAKEAALLAEQKALEETRSRFLSAIEALDDGFAIFDAEDRLVLWNSAYTRVFSRIADRIRPGALYDDLLRAAIDHGVFGPPGERDDAALQRRLNRGLTEPWDGEDELADGRLILVRERSTPGRETVGVYEDITARRLADRRLQQVVDGGELAVWDWDIDQGLSTINDRWRTMLGHDGRSATIADLFRLLHHQDRFSVLEERRRLFEGGADDFDFLCRMQHAQGHWVWLLSRGRVLARRSDGTPRRISGVTLDVSARIEAEQRLSRLIDGAQVGTWEHDMRTGVTLVSERWAEILGYRAAELNPMPLSVWLDLLHPDDKRDLLEHEARAFAAGQWQIEHEIRLRHRDGHWVWILSRTQAIEWDAAGRPIRTSGVNLDISAAKALEAALARERDTLARIMETSVSGIVAIDGAGRIVFANAAAEAVLGRPIAAGDDLPRMLIEAADPGAAGQANLPLMRAMSGEGVGRDMRHAIRWPDGSRRVILVNAARLTAPDTGLSVVCALTDITDAVENEERLRTAMIAAEAANRAKSDFLAAMSHEMRTPLNGVLGMARVLEGQEQDPDRREMLRIIRESGDHLLAVINDILDLAKIEAGRLVLDSRPLDLCSLVDRVLGVHRVQAGEKGLALRLVCRGEKRDQIRLGDEKRLAQILHNLVGNAVKFTDRGEVSLSIDATDAERLVMEVADTGPGMTEDDLEQVFEEFTQGQGGLARQHGGTGLGLTIVRRLAQLMGGEVVLSSAPGQGLSARVEVGLPRHEGPFEAGDAARLPDLAGLRVLAAEDNATNRIILHGVLRALGIEAEILPDGASAIRRWQQAPFDAVLLDIAMPGCDGLATLSAMQAAAQATGCAPPVALAVTANAMTHQVQDYRAKGFAGVVAKPLQPEDLARALIAALPSLRTT
ncbi:PAS domain S-box protein [Tabrizicola sp. YIM 78059]|uniref:PAS domain S-box protein n=1 Tax=Tabrizicola sp. YIM 78059 TaxID=2529861 RepID=UPI0010AA0A21|nr:PAS domain S-box protein [Tabrizicola sp. YIM 78059]